MNQLKKYRAKKGKCEICLEKTRNYFETELGQFHMCTNCFENKKPPYLGEE